MATDDPTRRPSAQDHYIYVLRFLLILAGIFGGTSIVLLGYDFYTTSKAADAAALLEGEPDAEKVKQAFELVETPHLFSGWRVPDQLWDEDHAQLGKFTEDALVKAVLAADADPLPTTGKAYGTCGTDLLCVAQVMGQVPKPEDDKTRVRLPDAAKWYRYLILRRAMAQGRALTEEETTFFRWNRTLWVRAFRAQVMDAQGTVSDSDLLLVRDLQESLEVSSRNGLIFGWYGLFSGLLFGLFAFLWRRWYRPDAEAT